MWVGTGMKHIGIITINDDTNYGNRLQNYAMQELLSNLEMQVYTIKNTGYRDLIYLKKNKILYLKILFSRYIEQFYKKNKCSNCLVNDGDIVKEQRKKEFQKFNDKYITFYNLNIESEYVPKKIKNFFDYFIVGSDQVWNPNYWIGKHTMYLRFAPKEKRIAIAASFGVDAIPESERKIVSHYLSDMKYISVREEEGKKIVKDLSGRDCDVIVDPTMLVPVTTWNMMLSNAKICLPKHYMLAYFLGDVSEERRNYIESIARKKQIEVIWMNDKRDSKTYQWGPEKFIKAIHDCECFFTDSFHGCVFSILFHRQFFVFSREGSQINMFGRINSLLNLVDMSSQIVCANNENLERKYISEQQFAYADMILERERVKTKKILEIVLK